MGSDVFVLVQDDEFVKKAAQHMLELAPHPPPTPRPAPPPGW